MERIIVNLTQHQGTPEQGVIEPEFKEKVKSLLTFENPPAREEMEERAQALLMVVCHEMDCHVDGDHAEWCAMIGGAPFFMPVLERVLRGGGVTPLYAFSRRESVEELVDGKKTVKKAVFRHVGFIEGAVLSRSASVGSVISQ